MSPAPAFANFRFDIESLLDPISEDAPSGESIRYEPVFDQIRHEREEDDPVLAQGVWKTNLRKADWSKVEGLCLSVLQNQSKDLQVACWLLEAWLHLYGFSGLREGLRTITALSEAFWEDLHPQIQDDDLEYRTAPINWLNEKLPVLLKLLPITSPQSDDVKTYCWADWETASRQKVSTDQPPKADDGGVTQARFQQSAMLTPTPFLKNLLYQLESVMDAVNELEGALDARCGKDSPSLRQFISTLEPVRGLVAGIISQRAPDSEPESEPVRQEVHMPQQDAVSESSPATAGVFSTGPIRSRAEAYMRLEEAAEYLSRTEPHSPAPYLVKRAIAWGSMRLEDILPELVRNNGELDEIFRLLKIHKDKGR